VDEEEHDLIRERMAMSGVVSLGAYLRKMAINGFHITLDLSDIWERKCLLKNATDNINQIARRMNETRNIYAEDVEDLRQKYNSLWEAANKILLGLSRIK